MDTLAHGLWGGAAFGRESRRDFYAAMVLGMAPDLLSFGPMFAQWALAGFPRRHRIPGEPPDPSLIPAYVGKTYNLTHSLIVWAAIFLLLTLWLKRRPRPFYAWALHILCDIPTHTTRFFPTPFLWPLPTPYVNGFRWGRPWFMLLNYSALALAYGTIFRARRRLHLESRVHR